MDENADVPRQDFHRDLLGSFNFQSLFCQLFENDIDVLASLRGSDKTSKPASSMAQHIAEAVAIALSIHKEDVIPVDIGKGGAKWKDLSPGTRSRLFHERLHYWQLISSPFLQFRLTLLLEKIRSEVVERGGNPTVIAGITAPATAPMPKDYLKYVSNVIDGPYYEFPIDNIIDIITIENKESESTEFLYVLGCRFRKEEGPELPGFGLALGSKENIKAAFPLSGQHILEGAAYIAQLLYEDKPLPQVKSADLAKREEHLYLGAWHFWCLHNAARYTNSGDLALAFLAAADLSMLTDLADLRWLENYKESGIHTGNCSDRFAYITITASSVPILSTDGIAQDNAIAKFQSDICRSQGWLTPEFILKKTAIYLTQLLFQVYHLIHHKERACKRVAKWLLNGPISNEDVRRLYPRLSEAWKLFEDYFEFRAGPLHAQRILGAMLNACLLRIRYPGRMAAPHLFESWIALHLPLPIIFLDGVYYPDLEHYQPMMHEGQGDSFFFEKEYGGMIGISSNAWFFTAASPDNSDLPYSIPALGVLPDAIWLTTASSLEHGNDECGFLVGQRKSSCFFVSQGLGCPRSPLSTEENEMRHKYNLSDWCHWKAHMTELGLIKTENQS